MKCGGKTLFCLATAFTLSAVDRLAAAGVPEGGHYHGIVERNVFNLKPPPPAVPPEPPAAPPPKVTLTGITTILDSKMALLKVSVPPRPPEPAKEESRILTENDRDGDIVVLEIDEKGGMVKINNHGTLQTLDFKNDGAKQVAVSMPTPMPAAPGTIPIPPSSVPNPIPPPPSATIRTIPSRTMRLPPSNGAPPTGASPTSGGRGFPSGAGAQQGNALSMEEQELVLAAQHLKATQEGNPVGPIIPLTPRVSRELYPNGQGQPLPPTPQ